MIQIEKIIPGGMALGTDTSGKKFFFWDALPGEFVLEYTITKNKSHYTEAIATKIEQPSPHRISPRDNCFFSTSPWQIIAYPYELQLKQSLVAEFFREHQINIDTPPIFTDDQDYHYRNKMEYALYWDNHTNQISLAFHARGSHRKIPITSSSIERPEILAAAQKIITDLNRRGESARKYQSLLLRTSQSGIISGGLYENGRPHPIFPQLTDTLMGYAYTYSPNGFFQINLPVYEMALAEIKNHIYTNQVLDLYAGVGTIGLSVARDKSLTLVEVDKFAFQELSKNCEKISQDSLNSIHPQAILAKSEDALNYLAPSQTVILDPPRAGCDLKLITKLLEVAPACIIYLSCNPATQARDVRSLLSKYQIKTIKTYNFFPHTPHIENLVVLEKTA